MQLDDYDFNLPEAQIAQIPLPVREDSRLMVVNRGLNTVRSGKFLSITDHFTEGDLLVVNNTQVIPARLLGTKESGGRIEVFLVRRVAAREQIWACLTRCSKAPPQGSRLFLGAGIEGTVVPGGEPPYRLIQFTCPGDFMAALEEAGHIPLPPYIRRDDTPMDRERYQTVFASVPGAVAAPTAGLHFTEQIFESLRGKGVEICSLTLHVGLGTFLPVRTENILEHRMHSEDFHIPPETAAAVNRAKEQGRRVFALGTTTTRTLEYAVDDDGTLVAGSGSSDLFIYPGFRFRIIDALITNFHLPRSTLLMLVSAFAGREKILEAYRRAIREDFRFFSYGDCMLIV